MRIIKKYGTLFALLFIYIGFSILSPDVFPTGRNLMNILLQISLLTIISQGATIIVVTKDFDLSIATLASLGGVIAAGLTVKGTNIYAAIGITLIIGTIIGIINGYIVAKLKISSFIATLATSTIIGGITFWYTQGATIFSGIPDAFLVFGQGKILGIPIPTILMFIVLGVSWFMLSHTEPGRKLYAVGEGPNVARLSGIDVERVRIMAFAISGFLGVLTGIILASRLGSAHPTAGNGYLLKAYAAVFLGMTVFGRGKANALGTFVGALIMGILANGLTILDVPYYFQDMLTGTIIIIALLIRGVKTE